MVRINRLFRFVLIGFISLAAGTLVFAETIRLAHGVIVKGEVAGVSKDGLQVKLAKGTKTYSWETLSPATRYRYDAEYRANYQAVLEGLPPSRRLNEAYQNLFAPASRIASEETDEPAASVGKRSLKLEDQVVYENVEPFTISMFPMLDLRSPELAAFWALQYGPGKEDVLYLAFDTKSPDDIRDAMFVYAPMAPDYKATVRQKGMKKRMGNQLAARFKEVAVESRFGEIKASFDVRCSFVTGRARDLDVYINVALAARDKKCRFLLFSQPTDLVYGEGEINVRGIIDLPVIWVGLDPASLEPRLIGDLRMSSMKLCPKRGMDNVVMIEIMDASGVETVDAIGLKIDEDSLEENYVISCMLPKLKRGRTYQVLANIDLGPFLGIVSYRDKLVIPLKPGN